MVDETITESWEFRLSHSPGELWPLVADTNRLNEALEMARYTVVERREGENRKLIAQGVEHAHPVEWVEDPFEWVAGQWWRYDRRYLKGPLARLNATLYLRRTPEGGSIAQFALSAEPNGKMGRNLIASGHIRRLGDSLMARAEEADRFLSGERPAPFSMRPPALPSAAQAEIKRCAALTSESDFANGVGPLLGDLVGAAPESEMMEMRVRRVARSLGVAERAAAEACLAAAAGGLLERRFLVLCPRCRRPSHSVARLADLPERGYCSADQIDFPVDLAVNVEAVFRPTSRARPIAAGVYCASGPMTAPHIVIQQKLDPGERRAFPFQARAGGYRIRVEDPSGRSLSPRGGFGMSHHYTLDFQGGRFPVVAATPDGVAIGAEPPDDAVVFENHANEARVIILELREWRADALTAAEIAPLQAYRALFPEDAPARPTRAGRAAFVAYLVGEREGVFARLGDGEAASRLARMAEAAEGLARARNGGVVRSQGERGLAAFLDPADAAGFALDLRASAPTILGDGRDAAEWGGPGGGESLVAMFQEMEEGPRWRPQLSFGLAGGRAIAAARGGRFDYSGFAPALAERLADEAAPGELAMSADLAEDPYVKETLGESARRADEVEIAGMPQRFPIVRAV